MPTVLNDRFAANIEFVQPTIKQPLNLLQVHNQSRSSLEGWGDNELEFHVVLQDIMIVFKGQGPFVCMESIPRNTANQKKNPRNTRVRNEGYKVEI